jgi:ferredoxin
LLAEGLLFVRLSGAKAAVEPRWRGWAVTSWATTPQVLAGLREQTHPFFANATSRCGASRCRRGAGLSLPGRRLVEWGGASAGSRPTDAAAAVHAAARAAGGHATLYRGGDRSRGIRRLRAAARLHQRLKKALTPRSHRPPQASERSTPTPTSTPGRDVRGPSRQEIHGNPSRRLHPDTPDGLEAEAILRRCVHCGFCTATCPTYQLLGDELDGPRGRIYLIKQVLEGAGRGPNRRSCTSTAA